MKLVIFSRAAWLYSTQRLLGAARARGHSVAVVDHMACQLSLRSGKLVVYHEGKLLPRFQLAVPRIGPSVTQAGAALLRALETRGVTTTLSADALLLSRDKFQCLQLLTAGGVQVPATHLVNAEGALRAAVAALGGCPLVVKQEGATHGDGVWLVRDYYELEPLVQALLKNTPRILLQEYIAEAAGRDVRALVVGEQVVAAMERQAPEGDFRANLHRGGTGRKVELSPEETRVAIRSAKMLGLEVAGVDLLRSESGPLVLEVNASPGLEGIEKASGINVSLEIIRHVEALRRRQKGSTYVDGHS